MNTYLLHIGVIFLFYESRYLTLQVESLDVGCTSSSIAELVTGQKTTD